MSGLSPIEAYDLLRFAEVFEERLTLANDTHQRRRGLAREKRWIGDAVELLKEAREGSDALLEKARELPELSEVREEFAGDLLQVWVDALEKLQAGITFHAGSRSPLIETLFPHVKFPALRKASRALVEQYQADLERRAALGYVGRMLAQETFTFAPPLLGQIAEAFAKWQTCFTTDALGPGDPEVREALLEHGQRLELAVRQARLLAEASLSSVRHAYEDSALAQKPRRRAQRPAQSAEETANLEAEAPELDEAAPLGTDEAAGGVDTAEEGADAAPEVPASEAPIAEETPDASEPAPRKRGARKAAKDVPASDA